MKHFHYTAWPDFGVPIHPSSLVKFVQQVRKEYKDITAPMVVHCRWVCQVEGVAGSGCGSIVYRLSVLGRSDSNGIGVPH